MITSCHFLSRCLTAPVPPQVVAVLWCKLKSEILGTSGLNSLTHQPVCCSSIISLGSTVWKKYGEHCYWGGRGWAHNSISSGTDVLHDGHGVGRVPYIFSFDPPESLRERLLVPLDEKGMSTWHWQILTRKPRTAVEKDEDPPRRTGSQRSEAQPPWSRIWGVFTRCRRKSYTEALRGRFNRSFGAWPFLADLWFWSVASAKQLSILLNRTGLLWAGYAVAMALSCSKDVRLRKVKWLVHIHVCCVQVLIYKGHRMVTQRGQCHWKKGLMSHSRRHAPHTRPQRNAKSGQEVEGSEPEVQPTVFIEQGRARWTTKTWLVWIILLGFELLGVPLGERAW